MVVDGDLCKGRVEMARREKKTSVDIPTITHVNLEANKATCNEFFHNTLIGTTPLLDITANSVWEHLIRMKVDLDCLIGLVDK